MTSSMMTIAQHLSTDFLEAVKEAEMTDREAIEKLMHDMNAALNDFENRDRILNTQAEQAIRTLNEIGDLRDVNWTTFVRRRTAYEEGMAKLRDSKTPAMDPLAQAAMNTTPNVVRMTAMGTDPQAQASRADAARIVKP
jgi:hypothetical protein